jgi:hypothetical protein
MCHFINQSIFYLILKKYFLQSKVLNHSSLIFNEKNFSEAITIKNAMNYLKY